MTNRLWSALIAAVVLFAASAPLPAFAGVGRTAGDASVSSRGAATYRIPLTLPAGAAGLTPTLSLEYSSSYPNGWLGMGFTIPELSMISRCPRTNVQDGGVGPFDPQFSTSDRFCIDAQRLRLVSGSVYGAAGTTYQTEIESFRKITITGADSFGPTAFEVRTAEGLIYSYGSTSDSQIRLATGSGALSQVRLHWAVSRIQDRAGNAIDFSYTQDAARGGYYPAEIRYTSHSSGVGALFKVVFVNEAAERPDPILNRLAYTGTGASPQFDFTRRLSRIDVVHIPTGGIVRRYELTYHPTSATVAHSFLQSVRECGAGGTDCLAPTTFAWNTPSSSIAAPITGPSIPANVTPVVIDINGDTRADLAWPSVSGGGTWMYQLANAAGGFDPAQNTGVSSAGHAGANVIEWDGDGRADLIFPGSANTWTVLRSNGSGFDGPVDTGISSNNVTGFADINGDGRDDLIVWVNGLYFQLNTGSAFGAQTFGVNLPWPVVSIYSGRSTQLQDFDGDTLEDFIVRYDQIGAGGGGATHTFKLKAIHGAGAALRVGVDFGETQYVGTGDFNGDKRTDVAYLLSGRIYTTLSTTAGPLAGTAQLIADWDGYGRDDLLVASGTWQVAPSVGTTFGTLINTGIAVGATSGTSARVGDFDGDAFVDLLTLTTASPASVQITRHTSISPWPFYGLMQSATDGYGLSASFTYGLLSDPQVHTAPTTFLFPLAAVNYPASAVRTLTQTDAGSGTSTYSISFTYEGARQHTTGRGFAGFAKRVIRDSRTPQLRVEESYNQSFPHVGALTNRSVKKDSNGALVQSLTNTWTSIPYGCCNEGRQFPYVTQSVLEQYELGGSFDGSKFLTTTTVVNAIDSTSGLRTDVTTTTTEGATGLYAGSQKSQRLWTSSVLNDTTNWCLGRPQTQQQINSHTLAGGGQLTRTFSTIWDGPLCRATQQTLEPGDTKWQVITSYGYDGFGNVNAVTQTPAAGWGQSARTSQIYWGSDGRAPRTLTNPKGHQTQLSWDFDPATAACPAASAVLGELHCMTDANAQTTRVDRDAFGRVSREQHPDGTATDYVLSACNAGNSYCGSSALRWSVSMSRRDTSNNTIRTDSQYFDVLDRQRQGYQQMLSGAMSGVIVSYDSLGRVASRSVPFVVGDPVWYTSYEYDALNRPTQMLRQASEVNTSLASTQISYQGLRTVTTDPLSHSSTLIRSAFGEIIQSIDAAGSDVDYEYDAFGHLLKTRDVHGNETAMTYNVRGMKLSSNDPDMGYWQYDYYPLGELKSQTNAKLQAAQFTYDALSRLLTRTDDPEGTTTFVYDTATNGIGQMSSVSSPGSHSESFAYDNRARLQTRSTVIDGTTYTYTYGYNASTGLLETLTYPVSFGTAFKIQYDYQYAQLKSIKDFYTPTTIYWEATSTDARHNVIDYRLGNGLVTNRTYDRISGFLDRIDSGFAGGSSQQQLVYTWDKVGNLLRRQDLNQGTLNEEFLYDSLDRLDIVRRNGVQTLNVDYDAIGNITSKSDVGSYTYHATRKHAVVAAGANSYSYDANGNAITRNGQTISWYSYDLPSQINGTGGKYAKFWYGPDRQRYKQEHHVYADPNAVLRTTIYVGDLYEKASNLNGPGSPATETFYRHYIVANGERVASVDRYRYATSSGTSDSTFYAYEAVDHLGSMDSVWFSGGTASDARFSNDAFGKRRDRDWDGPPSASDIEVAWYDFSNRGFTDHEHLDNVDGLIHMNGRVYDPAIGRFTSADPFVPAPYFSQSFNRYSYVFNNPLRFTDPSGFGPNDIDGNPVPSRGAFLDQGISTAELLEASRHVTPGRQQQEESARAALLNVDGTKVPGLAMATSVVGEVRAAVKDFFGSLSHFTVNLRTGEFSACRNDRSGCLELGDGFGQRDANALAGAVNSLLLLTPVGAEYKAASAASAAELRGLLAGSIRRVNPLKGAYNCVNCAIATDATLAGRPASALLSDETQLFVLEDLYGTSFNAVAGRQAIEELLINAGSGARGIVFGSRGIGQTGHVFNAVNQNGTIRFLDGQIGGVASFEGYEEFYFLWTN